MNSSPKKGSIFFSIFQYKSFILGGLSAYTYFLNINSSCFEYDGNLYPKNEIKKYVLDNGFLIITPNNYKSTLFTKSGNQARINLGNLGNKKALFLCLESLFGIHWS